MTIEYKVEIFLPKIVGCGSRDKGWDKDRCMQFQGFLNEHASENWKLHSHEYRQVDIVGCSYGKGVSLVCIFERSL